MLCERAGKGEGGEGVDEGDDGRGDRRQKEDNGARWTESHLYSLVLLCCCTRVHKDIYLKRLLFIFTLVKFKLEQIMYDNTYEGISSGLAVKTL